jgi:hypothetical protein
LGERREFEYCKITISRGRNNTNSSFSFWWISNDSATTTATESYNGSSWTTVNLLTNASRLLSGAGSQSAAFRIGGFPQTDVVESWNGTSWTSGTNLNTSRISQAAGAGNSNSCLAFGGKIHLLQQIVLEYNGTSWTSGGSLGNSKIVKVEDAELKQQL